MWKATFTTSEKDKFNGLNWLREEPIKNMKEIKKKSLKQNRIYCCLSLYTCTMRIKLNLIVHVIKSTKCGQ